MVLGIICFLFACLGIYGFYNEIYLLTYLGLGLCLFENIIGIIEGTSKTIMPTIIAGIIGWIIIDNFWLGIALGICFENVIMFIGGCIMLLFFPSANSQNNKENDLNDNPAIDIMQETIDNAKKDLKTGITKEQLDTMLENGYITQDKYNELLENIKALEMISSFDIGE